MLATVRSATVVGVRGVPVSVEVHAARGIPAFTIVGLPDASCREARDRVRAAIVTSGLDWPDLRLTVNLAPSGVRKVGAGLDLAIAVGILVASGQLNVAPGDPLPAAIGELGLDGSLRHVPGMLAMAAAVPEGRLLVPAVDGVEAAVVGGHEVRCVASLAGLVAAWKGQDEWATAGEPAEVGPTVGGVDLAEVRGHPGARFALEVAAAGGHHLLMVGPPGSGKTMLAERLSGLLGPLPRAQAVEVTTIHSSAGQAVPAGGLIPSPPFRAPHHSSSLVALVGGGSHALRPGEVSLAHRGVLFLDELAEFAPRVLECLRQPLEEGVVRVSRAHASAEMPASFQLVAAMNPCPCGSGGEECRCSAAALERFTRRLSGPLLDRFDLRVGVEATDAARLVSDEPGECSAAVAERVAAARDRAMTRGVPCNRVLGAAALAEFSSLSTDAADLLRVALASGRLSARGAQRVRRVALTLDDLRGGDGRLAAATVATAMGLRVALNIGGGERR